MKKLRLGFIGAGGIAARHIEALRQFDDVEITAITNPTAAKAHGLAQKFGLDARIYENYSDLLKGGTLDAVYICVPPFAHGEIETAVIKQDLPFLVEKPLAVDLTTAENIAAQVAAKGLVTAVGYQWRYLNTSELARQRLAEHPARLVHGYWWDKTPPTAWWSVPARSGGQIIEQTTHMFDLARWLVGEIRDVTAIGEQSRGAESVDTASVVSVRFENGAIGTFTSSCLLNRLYQRGLQLVSAGQTLELSYQELITDDGQSEPRRETVNVEPFVRLNRDFLDAVAGRANNVRSDYADALKTHRVTVAAQEDINR
jgi:predicted dehydrogenase